MPPPQSPPHQRGSQAPMRSQPLSGSPPRPASPTSLFSPSTSTPSTPSNDALMPASQIIMIHRPFLLPSFRNPTYAQIRRTCVAAARTILRHHERHAQEDRISLWTHSAFAITAANVLSLELYHTADTDDAEAAAVRDVLVKARDRLGMRKGDLLGKRSAELIGAILQFDEERVQARVAGGVGGLPDLFGAEWSSFGLFGLDGAVAGMVGGDLEAEGVGWGFEDGLRGGNVLTLEEFEPWFTHAFFASGEAL